MTRLAILAALLLTACAPQQAIRQPTPAIAVMCPAATAAFIAEDGQTVLRTAKCDVKCIPERGNWPRWTCIDYDSPDCWDNAPIPAVENRAIAETCEVARMACHSCLLRIQRAGVITGAVK